MTVPDAANSASRTTRAWAGTPSSTGTGRVTDPDGTGTPIRTEAVEPRASAIWEATVRFQTSSYSRNSSPRSSPATWAGVRKESPAGRIASWASCAFLALLA